MDHIARDIKAQPVAVTFRVTTPLHRIPEMYWGEDLSLLDREYTGTVIGTSGVLSTYLVVVCTDGRVRECPIEDARIVPLV